MKAKYGLSISLFVVRISDSCRIRLPKCNSTVSLVILARMLPSLRFKLLGLDSGDFDFRSFFRTTQNLQHLLYVAGKPSQTSFRHLRDLLANSRAKTDANNRRHRGEQNLEVSLALSLLPNLSLPQHEHQHSPHHHHSSHRPRRRRWSCRRFVSFDFDFSRSADALFAALGGNHGAAGHHGVAGQQPGAAGVVGAVTVSFVVSVLPMTED